MQLLLAVADPTEPARILPQDGRAWFALNHRESNGRMRQWPFEADQLEDVLRMVTGKPDFYTSQALFDCPKRRSAHVQYITHAYVDLDIYRIPEMSGLSRDAWAMAIRTYCMNDDIPVPSVILSSGRGMYCKWYLSSPVGREWVGNLVAINRALVRRLAGFGADPKATDASRILRLTGSVHSGVGREVEIIHQEQHNGRVITYDADTFARRIAPGTSDEPIVVAIPTVGRAPRQRPIGGHKFSREGWFWTIVEDIRRLVQLRYGATGGLVDEGMRDLFGHAIAATLMRIFPADLLMDEIIAQCAMILPAGYIRRDLRPHCHTLLEMAKQRRAYAYGKDRLIQLLEIGADEQRHMRALISDAEKYRRERARQTAARRADGVMERLVYEAPAAARRARVIDLRAQEWTWRAIAAELGISASEARRLAEN